MHVIYDAVTPSAPQTGVARRNRMPQDRLTSKGKIRGFEMSDRWSRKDARGRSIERGWLGQTQLGGNFSSQCFHRLPYLSEVEFPNLKRKKKKIFITKHYEETIGRLLIITAHDEKYIPYYSSSKTLMFPILVLRY